jgi:hypothetical protein
MRQVALIEDKLTKQTFAVLVLSNREPIAFGALGQGEVWANWANNEKMTIEAIRQSLDLTLTIGEMSEVGSIDIDSIEEKFSQNTFAELKNEVSKKALIRIVETKNSPPYFPANSSPGDEFNIEDDYSVEENILNWPITDIGLASIDVAYKQIAINYKTKAFIHDTKNSSLTLQVKGVRAVWDTNMPGGGGWRCPDDTPFGGQYTNRLGTGCTFGMVRRIGRGMIGASLRDITKPSDDLSNIDKPALLRAGQRLEAGAEKRRVTRVEKFGRRAARRVEKADKRTAKEKLRAANPTARDIYGSLNPDMTRRDRARIAAGTVIARVGNDIRNDAFNTATSRRAARRIPTSTPNPKDNKFKRDKKIPLEYRHTGGILPKKLSNNGSILLGDGLLINLDEMIDSDEVVNELKLIGVRDPLDVSKTGYDLTNVIGDYITQKERLDILHTAKVTSNLYGNQKQIDTIDAYRDALANYSGAKVLTRKETEDFLSPENSFNRKYTRPDQLISDELRTNGGTIPLDIADNGIYYNDATGEISDFQGMIDTQKWLGNKSTQITQQLTDSANRYFDNNIPAYITPNEMYAIDYNSSIAKEFLFEFAADGSRQPNPDIGRRLDPFDRNDALIIGEETVNELLSTGTGRRGSNRRAAIARRMRQTADDLVNPDRRKNRRISKINDTSQSVGIAGAQVGAPKNNNKRKNRGSKPNTPGIVQRIGQSTGIFGPPPTDTERAIRELQGRRPRPTDARRERAAKFMRRMASRIRQEPVNPQDEVNYATPPQNYPLDPRLGGQRVSPSMRLSARHIFNGDPRIASLLQDFPAPPALLQSIWQSDESTFAAVLELNNLLTDKNRQPLLPDSFDDSNQTELQGVIDEWSKLFNDPNGPAPAQGAPSNYGLTIEYTDTAGNNIRYSSRKNNQPPIYIEASDGSAAHFMDDEGHHLVSAVVITDANGNDEVKYIASDYVKNEIQKSQTPAQNAKPTFIQRVLGRFRRPANQQQQQAVPSTRARVRSVTNSSTRSGLRFSKTTTGPELPDASTLSALDKSLLSSEMQKELDYREDSFRKKLGKAVGDTNPLTEDELLGWIDNLSKTDARRAGIEETNLHNFLVLTDFESTKDHNLINDLKPSLRKRVMDNAKVTGTGVDPVKRRPYTPYGPNRGNTPQTPGGGATSPVPVSPTPSAPPAPTPTPSTPPVPTPSIAPSVTPSAPVIPTTTPIPRAPGTGQTITPGVGNSALGIVFDTKSGLYIDTSTGEFVEDLSNLPIDQHSIYTPKPLVLDGGAGVGNVFPHIAVDTNNALTKGIPVLRVAPGVDPNTPSLDITVKPKTAAAKNHYIGVISSFKNAVRKRLEEHKKGGNKKISAQTEAPLSELSYVDTRGARVTNDVTQPVFPLLKDLDATIAVQLIQNAATSNEIFDGENWLSRSVTNASTNLKLIADGAAYPNNAYLDNGSFNVERLGLDPNLPIGEFYLPDASYRSRTTTAGMIIPINRALQLEHAANNPIPGSTQQEIDSLRQKANLAWLDAQRNISAVHATAVDARDNALSGWRRELSTNKRRNKGLQDIYIFQGAIAEQAAHLLERHIVNNPPALAAIENAIRTGMEDRAKRSNERTRRVALRAAQGLPRAEGLYDNQPSILNPWNSPTPPQSLRTASEIINIRDDHRAQTMFEFITHGAPATISDEQIDLLDILGEIYDTGLANPGQPIVGPPGSRIDGIVYPDHGTAHVGAVWQYNGFNSFPVLASREEIVEMLKEMDSNGEPKYVVISRGLGGKNREPASKQLQMVNDALTGDRFIPGQGGNASGRGEYWSQSPSAWSTYHGHKGGTMVGVISQDSKLVNRKQFGAIFGGEHPRGTGTDGESYESLWALYNALGAPDAPGGTNPVHGEFSTYGIPVDSLKLNLNSRTLSSQQIAELDAHIDRLTAKGTAVAPGQKPDSTWGTATIEGMNRDGRLDRNMKEALFPSASDAASMSMEELQEIEDTKELWNAWMQQRMTYISDLAKLLEDESAGLQGAVDNNKKILRAMRSHIFMRGENVATMMGYDGFAAEGINDSSITPSQIWKHALNGSIGRIVMLNRSSMILEHKSINDYVDYYPVLQAIQYPNGKTATLRPGNWS